MEKRTECEGVRESMKKEEEEERRREEDGHVSAP